MKPDRRPLLALLALLLAGFAPPAAGEEPATFTLATAAARVTLDLSAAGGAIARFELPGGVAAAGGSPPALDLRSEGVPIPLAGLMLRSVQREHRADGAVAALARWTPDPARAPLLAIERRFTLRADVAGLLVETRIESAAPLYLTTYRLLSLDAGPALAGAALVAHDYNGGADWNDVFHRSTAAAPPFEGRAQLLHADGGDGPGLVLTLVRRGAEGSRLRTEAGADGAARLHAGVDLSRELITTGPVPPYAVHAGATPGQAGVRGLPVRPLVPLDLEPVLVAAGRDGLGTLWAHHALLAFEAPGAFEPRVAYNTNVWDGERQPPADVEEEIFGLLYRELGNTPYMGMNRSIFEREVPLARLAGVQTFILDDGWQYLSGDWNPHPSRFPGSLAPERALLEANGMDLGLWMSPVEFNLRSRTALTHPEWVCQPTGTATALLPDQAGFGIWHAASGYRDHLLRELARMSQAHGASFLKLDFVTWVDCPGAQPATIHEYAAALRSVLARANRELPGLVLQMDETNDHRLFPFESVWHGPSWFKNGGPSLGDGLGILRSLAPFVPLHTVGVPVLHGKALAEPDSLVGPASLWGHPTVWSRLSDVPRARLAAAGTWFRFYADNAPLFQGLTVPLDGPEGTFAFERVRPDLGLAFVALLDPDGRLAPGAPVRVEARLPCAGLVAVEDPFGAPRAEVAPGPGGRVALDLVPRAAADAVMLRCDAPGA